MDAAAPETPAGLLEVLRSAIDLYAGIFRFEEMTN